MKVLKNIKSLVISIAVGIFQFALLYFTIYLALKNIMLISQNSVTWNNITMKFLEDYSAMLLLPTILIIINRRHLSDFGLCYESKREIFILLVILILLFICHNDFTITGLYKFLFYLVVVAFGEEFIYRGFLYNRLKCNSKVVAIILSGTLWGICHAIMPSIIHNADIGKYLLSMCNEIGGGIVFGWYFIYLQEKSKTLWIPILIHAILDYTVGVIGTFTAIGILVYFWVKSKQQRIKQF